MKIRRLNRYIYWCLVLAGVKVNSRKTSDPSEHSITSVVSEVKCDSVQGPMFGMCLLIQSRLLTASYAIVVMTLSVRPFVSKMTCPNFTHTFVPGTSAGFRLGGSMPPCRLRRRKFWKSDYEMVHSEVYLNKYVVSIAPFSTPACPDCSQKIT